MAPPAGGPAFGFGFLSDYTTVGTPSLRSLQGRDAMPSIRHVFVPLCEYSNSHPSQSARRIDWIRAKARFEPGSLVLRIKDAGKKGVGQAPTLFTGAFWTVKTVRPA